jgi:hypothetical protein
MGAFMQFIVSPMLGVTNFHLHSNQPITGESVLRHAQIFRVFLHNSPSKNRGLFILAVPSLLVDIANSGDKAIAELAELTTYVQYSGAPMPEASGEALARGGVNLGSLFGMSEIFIPIKVTVPPKPRVNGEWQYLKWGCCYNMLMIPTNDPSLVELIVQACHSLYRMVFFTDFQSNSLGWPFRL